MPMQLPAPLSPGAIPMVAQVSEDPGHATPAAPPGGADPFGTVGLALLAYGLIQLLSKVVDRLPVGRRAGDGGGAEAGFSGEDRKRLERVFDLVTQDATRRDRVDEQFAVQQRLIGQALDELRGTDVKLDRALRGLRRLWRHARRGSRRA